MNWQTDKEITAVFISIKNSQWRTVVLQCTLNLWNPCCSSFGKTQLLEKLTNTTVAVTPINCLSCDQIIKPDRTIRTGIAQDCDFSYCNTHFDGLSDLIGSMINGIDQRFFDSSKRIIPDSNSFRLIRLLQNDLVKKVAMNIFERISQHMPYWTGEGFFHNSIATGTVRQPDNINPSIRKIFFWMISKKHQPNILGKQCFRRPAHYIHLCTKCRKF